MIWFQQSWVVIASLLKLFHWIRLQIIVSSILSSKTLSHSEPGGIVQTICFIAKKNNNHAWACDQSYSNSRRHLSLCHGTCMQQHPQLQMPMLAYHSNLNTKWPSWNQKTTKINKQEDHYGKCANKCNKLNMQQRAKHICERLLAQFKRVGSSNLELQMSGIAMCTRWMALRGEGISGTESSENRSTNWRNWLLNSNKIKPHDQTAVFAFAVKQLRTTGPIETNWPMQRVQTLLSIYTWT